MVDLNFYKDQSYGDFTAKLIPNIDRGKILGIRMTTLRKLAKEIYKNEGLGFLENLPHFYHEENMIHGLLINEIKDGDLAREKLLAFGPYLENWAQTDVIKPKAFKKNLTIARETARELISRAAEYQVRMGVILLMNLQGENFLPSDLDQIVQIKSDFYYVNMARAWYMAELLVKNFDSAFETLENKILDDWTQNKAIQKARESYRIPSQIKDRLLEFRV